MYIRYRVITHNVVTTSFEHLLCTSLCSNLKCELDPYTSPLSTVTPSCR